MYHESNKCIRPPSNSPTLPSVKSTWVRRAEMMRTSELYDNFRLFRERKPIRNDYSNK